MQGDAADFTLSEPVDVVFSNAVFHWIDREKQQDILKCIYNVLRKNGQFVFEFGGHGNNQKYTVHWQEFFQSMVIAMKCRFTFQPLESMRQG